MTSFFSKASSVTNWIDFLHILLICLLNLALGRVVGVDLPPKRLREFAEGEEVAQGIGPFGDGFVFGPHSP